jgi:hypothetical protein
LSKLYPFNHFLTIYYYLKSVIVKQVYNTLRGLKGYIIRTNVGGRTLAKRNPTRTILGNQAIKQEANAYINIKQ